MDIEKYSSEHPHYWSKQFSGPEIEFLFANNSFNKLIDVGCGDGVLLYALKEKGYLASIKEKWATDLSIKRLMGIKKTFKGIKTKQDDAQELSKMPKNYFDTVLTTQVIEHVKDDGAMLKAMKKICKIGGIIFIETVFKKKYAWYFNKNQYGERVLDPTHEREYTSENELFDKVKLSGLKIVYERKRQLRFPIVDFFIRRFKIRDPNFFIAHPFFGAIRKITIPVIGYYSWFIVLIKSDN